MRVPHGVSSRLLLLLATQPSRVVHDGVLVDRLWNDDRPPQSMGALRNAVMRLGDYWAIGRNQAEGERMLSDAICSTPEVRSVERLSALVALPRLTGTSAGALRYESQSREAMALAASLGRADLEAEARLFVGMAELCSGRLEAGIKSLRGVADSPANPWAAISAGVVIGLMGIASGDVEGSRRTLHLAARRYRAAGDRIGEASALVQSGTALQRLRAATGRSGPPRRSRGRCGQPLARRVACRVRARRDPPPARPRSGSRTVATGEQPVAPDR